MKFETNKKIELQNWLQLLLLLYLQISQSKPIKTQHKKQQNKVLKVFFKISTKESYTIRFQNLTISHSLTLHRKKKKKTKQNKTKANIYKHFDRKP